jgi:cold shock CspA family protein
VNRETGTVVRYFADRKPFAFGFIRADTIDGDDFFISEVGLQKAGLRSLTPGERVSFEARIDKVGKRQAWNVALLPA